MNALFGEQNFNVVEYSAEQTLPELLHLDGFQIHHESLFAKEHQAFIEEVGGQITGDVITHSNGDTIDHTQFNDNSSK